MTAATSASARSSPLAAAFLLGLATAAASCARHDDRAPPATPMGTERWLDFPHRLRVEAPAAAHAAPGEGATSRFWDAEAIRARWTRSEAHGQLTLASPPLDFPSPGALDSVEVRFSETGELQRFWLLWGPEPRLDARAELRNRRELTLLGEPKQRVFRVRGDEIAYQPLARGEPGRGPLRHVLLRLPAARRGARLQSVALISKRDALASQPHAAVRHTLRGETRTAYQLAAPARLGYETRLAAGAQLRFGVLTLAPQARLRCSLALASGARERVLLDRRLPAAGREWHDFEVPIPEAGADSVRLSLSLESDVPGDRVLVSNPALVVPGLARERPNVVLYVIDSLRPDRLGFGGYAKATSPFLDSLARQGVVFRNAYAQSTWTKPAVATLLTSLHPQTHGVGARSSFDALPDSVATLQDLLRSEGYLTAQFTANPFAGALSNLDQGFDWAFGPEAFEIEDAARKRDKPHSDDVHARLRPWLEAHAAAPLFVYVHTIDPHPPLSLPGGYDDAVRFNDDQLRALVEALDARGLLRDTLLVVTSDHGERLGEHGDSGHGLSVHQAELRVPLLLWRRGRLAPAVVERNARSLDVMPTILRQSGVSFDPGLLQGRDLLQGAADAPVWASRFVYPDASDLPQFFGREQLALIDGRSKLVVRQLEAGARSRQLFDLAADPGEDHDLGAQDPERVRRLERSLDEFLERQRAARAAFLRAHGDAAAPRSPPPQDLLERLRALGYLK